MPQLMRAVDDPGAAPDKLSRMITHELLHTRNVITTEEALATAKDAGLDDTIGVPILG